MAKKKFLNRGGITDIIQKAEAQNKDNDAFVKENIKVLPELERLIFPLSDDEFELLTSNILLEGCREALVLWKNQDEFILIDGHNRYKICQKHNVNFKILVKDFKDIEAAKDWMINNQLGRRNVTEETKSWLRGLQYKREKKKQGWQVSSAKNVGVAPKEGNQKRTVQIIAEQHKVSSSTVQRDEKFVDAVEILSGLDISLKKDVLNRKIRIPKTQLINLAEKDKKALEQIGLLLKKGKSWKDSVRAIAYNEISDVREELNKLKKAIFKDIEKAIDNNDVTMADQAINRLKKLKKALL